VSPVQFPALIFSQQFSFPDAAGSQEKEERVYYALLSVITR
jgi:hypothetical protein